MHHVPLVEEINKYQKLNKTKTKKLMKTFQVVRIHHLLIFHLSKKEKNENELINSSKATTTITKTKKQGDNILSVIM